MVWEKDLKRVSERKIESGPFSTETGGRPLTADKGYRLMDIILFTYSSKEINSSTSVIFVVLMLWTSLNKQD
jgi:hypothetical protein